MGLLPVFGYSRRFCSQALTRYRVQTSPPFTSNIFPVVDIQLADRNERIVRGSRDLFPKLSQAFRDIRQIGIIGWGPQGQAQSQNLRDSLAGTPIKVKVGLRENSSSIPLAGKAGFRKEDGTLGEMYTVISESDLTLLLVADGVYPEIYKKVFQHIKPDSYLGLSHGFMLGYLQSINKSFPENINVVAVCPKGMGASVRRLYEQGNAVGGSGINCSFAVHQETPNKRGRSVDVALGWAIALGSPVTFQTNLEAEYKSDIFGERGILLGGVHGICEMLYRYFMTVVKCSPEEAYIRSVEVITGPISKTISREGLLSIYNKKIKDKKLFEKAYKAAYHPAMDVLLEIYEDVASGREILSVVDHVRRLEYYPLQNIDSTAMWATAGKVRVNRNKWNIANKDDLPIDEVTAGVYLATMVAQCDVLMMAGHEYSEVANESIIESVDSLNPYMHFKGVSYMVDNCSTTARLGARKWAPRFDYLFQQQFLRDFLNPGDLSERNKLIEDFKAHKVHDVVRVCASLRPSVDIMPEETLLEKAR